MKDGKGGALTLKKKPKVMAKVSKGETVHTPRRRTS